MLKKADRDRQVHVLKELQHRASQQAMQKMTKKSKRQ